MKYICVCSCRIFDPQKMVAMSSKKLSILMNNIISHLLSLKIINVTYSDIVRDQFTDFMKIEVKLHKGKFLSFLKSGDEID